MKVWIMTPLTKKNSSELKSEELREEYEKIIGIYTTMVSDILPTLNELGDIRLYLFELTSELFKRGLITKEDKEKLNADLEATGSAK